MANNKGKSRAKYPRSTGGGAKISNGIKAAIITLTSLLVAATLTIVAAVGSYGFRESDYKKWFGRGNNVSIEKPDDGNQAEVKSWGRAIDDVGNVLDSEVTYAMPQAIAFMSDLPEAEIATTALEAPGVTVTATPTLPFTKVAVDWSVTYPDGSDASSAVTITPTTDGATTATLKCLQPFSQQITLTVMARDGSGMSDTAKVDYIKRIESIHEVYFQNPGPLTTEEDAQLYIDVNHGIGTTYGDFILERCTMYLDSDFVNMVAKRLASELDFSDITYEEVYPYYDIRTDGNGKYYTDGDDITGNCFQTFVQDYNVDKNIKLPGDGPASWATLQDQQDAIKYAWNAAYKEYHATHDRANVAMTLEISVRRNNSVIQTFELDNIRPESDFYGVPDDQVPSNSLYLNITGQEF